MKNLNIEDIREFAKQNKIKWTEHCSFRMFERMIHKSDIIEAILNGKIIEIYPDDYPYPSCLILGLDNNKNSLHVVCGIGKEYLYMITSYYPTDIDWHDNTKRRN